MKIVVPKSCNHHVAHLPTHAYTHWKGHSHLPCRAAWSATKAPFNQKRGSFPRYCPIFECVWRCD